MSFEDFEDSQDEPRLRQYPGGVPLGMRILNLMANRMPQPGGTGMPMDHDPQPLNPDGQIVDMGPQLRMPSRINLPVPSSDSAVPPLGLGLQQLRRVLDGLLGINRPQDVAQSDSSGQGSEASFQRTSSRILPAQTPTAPAGPPQGPQPQGSPNQPTRGGRNQAHGHQRGHNPTPAPPNNLEEQLMRDEGIRRDANGQVIPYRDTRGNWTIGWGHNLHGQPSGPITDQQAHTTFRQDIDTATRQVNRAFPWARGLDDVHREVLINMAFNMDIGRLRGFHDMLRALENHDYERAAQEITNSDFGRARDTRHRAARLADQTRTGQRR